MSKKKPNTPRSRIRSCLRQLWLRSRERAAALKRSDYRCVRCNVKQSHAKGKSVKIEVHHTDGIKCWDEIIDLIEEKLLRSHQFPLCKDCHRHVHSSK